jgi:MoaA/NifB/PqqE/SkfB family radical SAM enzyme
MNSDMKRLNIELSALCNYKCEGCPNTYIERPKGHMSNDLFKNIIDEIEGKVEKIFLWNYGEPTLNPKIDEMLEYVRGKNIKSCLSTTASNLYLNDDLNFLSSLNELIVSVNGFSQETYEYHQKNGNLEKVLWSLDKMRPVMREADTDYVLQIVVNKENMKELSFALDFAKQ